MIVGHYKFRRAHNGIFGGLRTECFQLYMDIFFSNLNCYGVNSALCENCHMITLF